MCNNNGHCRKFDAGTMCPSYRVTRDEQHLTRGRANTLRLALSGQLGPEFASEAVRDALDLCVSCKGCRRDCPTGVDMAKMKIEFLHHWQQRARAVAEGPRRSRTCRAGRRGRRACRGSSTCANAVRASRALGERTLGLSAKRSLPRMAARHVPVRGARRRREAPTTADVVLFVDTFTNYFEPENAHAALAVLQAAGYRVAIARALADDADAARPLCCGRTYLAAGLVDEAKREARRVVAALAPHVERGATIVGLEPSCLLSLRDEFLVLGLGDAAQRARRAARC